MNDRTEISYLRIIAEGLAIVLSILLAFAIDAAWDERQEEKRETAALNALAADFEDSRKRIAEAIATHTEFRDSARALLDLLDKNDVNIESGSIDGMLNDVFIDAKTTEVPNGSLDALFASGSLDLIENKALRSRLAAWPSLVENATEDERWIVNDVQQHFMPYLNSKILARNAYRYSTFVDDDDIEAAIPPRAATDYAALWADPTFDNLVTNRLSNEMYALAELRNLAAEAEQILALIELELRP